MRTVILGASIALAVLLCACRQSLDLGAVRTMANEAAASSDTFDAVSADFYDSCLRGLQYQNRFDVALCSKQRVASKLWQSANSILLSYVSSLGALATDSQSDYGLGDLTSAVAGIKGVTFTSAQQSAIVDAGKGLLSGIYSAKRREALATVMTDAETPDPAHNCPDGCLIDLVKQLKAIAQDEYRDGILSVEDSRIQLFYTNDISLAEATPSPARAAAAAPQLNSIAALGRLVAIRYYLDEASARQDVAKRKAAADTYASALDQIVSAHHSILAAIHDNRPEAIAGIAQSFIATYSSQLASIKKAFP